MQRNHFIRYSEDVTYNIFYDIKFTRLVNEEFFLIPSFSFKYNKITEFILFYDSYRSINIAFNFLNFKFYASFSKLVS